MVYVLPVSIRKSVSTVLISPGTYQHVELITSTTPSSNGRSSVSDTAEFVASNSALTSFPVDFDPCQIQDFHPVS